MLRLLALTTSVLCAAALAAGAGAATRQCQARSVGPGSLHRGGTAGAACLLAAFQQGCRPAEYLLSSFGVDTAATEDFRTERKSGGRCSVVVLTSFRVVPQQPRVFPTRTCSRLRKVGSDVVADHCTAGTPAAISLTSLR
jgi:hypothetical protein